MQVRYAIYNLDGYIVSIEEPTRRRIWRSPKNPLDGYVTLCSAVEADRIDSTLKAIMHSPPIAAGQGELRHVKDRSAVLSVGDAGRYKDYWLQELANESVLFEGCDPSLESRDDIMFVPPPSTPQSGVPVRTNASGIEPLSRDLGVALLVASVLVTLFCGTFPFDFAEPAGSAAAQFKQHFDWRLLPRGVGYSDRVQNMLFLLPFGFAAASMVRRRRHRAILQVAAGLIAGTALSLTIEILQAFVGFRDPSLVDVWCNALGAAIGAGVHVLVGDQLMLLAARALMTLTPLAKPWVLGVVLGAYALFHLAAPVAMRPAADLGFWDPNMPLLVGNELSGNRGWSGTVADIVLADRAVRDDAVPSLYQGAAPHDVLGDSLIAFYPLRGRSPYADEAGNLPPLDWTAQQPAPSDSMTAQGAVVALDNWLQTTGNVSTAIQRISKTSAFTLICNAATSSLMQHGPARIVGISSSTGTRNLQLGQEDADLVVRVRTAVHTMPDLYVRDVFADTAAHHIVVKTSDGVIVTYVDGAERGRCQITPEAKAIWRIYPRPNFRLRVEHYGFRSYAAVYRLLVFIPFATLLGATLLVSKLSSGAKWIVAIVVTIAYTIALELVLARQAATYGFQFRNFVISLIIAFGTLALLTWWQRHHARAAALL